MQSYIVRIYRNEKGALLGVVEDPDSKEKRAFADCEELWQILNSRKRIYLKGRSRKYRKRTVIPAGHAAVGHAKRTR